MDKNKLYLTKVLFSLKKNRNYNHRESFRQARVQAQACLSEHGLHPITETAYNNSIFEYI